VRDGEVVDVAPHPEDPEPSPLLGNVASSLRHPTRVAMPAIRRGWLEGGPGPDDRRGADQFVTVSWDEALDRLAAELQRVRETAGPQAVLVGAAEPVLRHGTSWEVIAEHTELLVAFGGVPAKNVPRKCGGNPGGITLHRVGQHLRRASARGLDVALFSPLRDDVPGDVAATWYPLRPANDVAVMLGLAHTLLDEGLADGAFLDR
jgi:biotin/methionine sulfoxide reductase